MCQTWEAIKTSIFLRVGKNKNTKQGSVGEKGCVQKSENGLVAILKSRQFKVSTVAK